MDSQENALNQGNLQDEKKVEGPVVEEATATDSQVQNAQGDTPKETDEGPQAEVSVTEGKTEEPESDASPKADDPAKKVYTSKKEVLERVKEIASSDEIPNKEEIDHLKTTFYKIHNAERDEQQKEYLEAGGKPEEYEVLPDEDEEMFKAEMGIIKEKRAKQFQEQEAEKQENLEKKLEIIEKIKSLATSPEEANKSYQEFKDLQQQWKEIKAVPADKANELWRNYQLYVEQFYDLLKLNSEAREYDFKKNLELKTKPIYNQECFAV